MSETSQVSRAGVILAIFGMIGAFSPVQGADADGQAGAQLWANACARCHNMRDPGDFRDQNWRPIVSHMRVRAGLTGEDSRLILEFLQSSNQPAFRGVAANSGTSSAASPLPAGKAAPDPIAGAAMFQRDCVVCHGKDGKGAIPGVRDFNAVDGPLAKPDEELFTNIVNGFQSPGSPLAMPHHGGKEALSDTDIRSILSYLRQEFGRWP